MGKSEISGNSKDYITDIARPIQNQLDIKDLDYKSDRSELALEKVKMVSQK
jgi:hypothetical protein